MLFARRSGMGSLPITVAPSSFESMARSSPIGPNPTNHCRLTRGHARLFHCLDARAFTGSIKRRFIETDIVRNGHHPTFEATQGKARTYWAIRLRWDQNRQG